MIVTVFRNRVRPEAGDEYAIEAERAFALAAAMPGFLGAKDYVADDGERVSIIEFADAEAHAAWRDHPEHQLLQEAGRERYYAEYRIQVCALLKDRRFPA
jgi:heme-degrading monooxygenase HmoA